ncbi:MAG: hypothetical protein HGA29_07345, partial [Syntrophaceae bacterium]|nr:hypothetical protein [Syntrophaceae bacterium]
MSLLRDFWLQKVNRSFEQRRFFTNPLILNHLKRAGRVEHGLAVAAQLEDEGIRCPPPVGYWAFTVGKAVDGSGNAYVTGGTHSTDFPTVNAKYSDRGFSDAFVFKLSSDGQTVHYSTYLGGSSDETSLGIAVDSYGNAYVTGTTWSSDFPKVKAKYPNLLGIQDAFVF